jgi:hypothetical protein
MAPIGTKLRFLEMKVSQGAASFGRTLLAEPVSPELVLVDSELARRERAKLEERAQLRAIHEADDLRRAVERTLDVSTVAEAIPLRSRAAASGRRALAAALFCSLLANGYFVSKLVTRSPSVSPVAAVVPPSLATTNDQSASVVQNIPQALPPPTYVSAPQRAAARKAAVEQKLVSLILSAPAGKLPKPFLDPTTGLVKNNVQVACRLKAKRTFLCAIRPPASGTRPRLLVRYSVRENGTGVFHWFK